MVWSSGHVGTLIEEYQKYPCLYVTKHPLYHKRNARVNALKKICEVLCEVRPKTTLEEIKAEFFSLRTTYLIEKKKMEKAMKSGAGVDGVYVPSLWYFEKISFLNEHVTPRPSTSNLDNCEEQESHRILSPVIDYSQNDIPLIENEEEYEDENNLTQSRYEYETRDSESEQYEEIIIEAPMDVVVQRNDTNSEKQTTPQNKKRKINKKKNEGPEDDVLKDASRALYNITNAIKTAPQETHSAEDKYGKSVAERLKSMPDVKKRLRAQQAIDAILYQFLIDD